MNEVRRGDSDSEIVPWKQPVSTEWQKSCKHNASGIMAASFTAGFAWIVASHTFIALNNGRIVHPSSLGWPLYTCIVIFIIGAYAYLSSEYEQLPIPGRKYTPVDHSAKDSLWYEKLSVKWSAPYGSDSDRTAASVGPVLSNANSSTTLLVKLEELSASIEGKSTLSHDALTFTLPPGRSQDIQSPGIEQIPSGAQTGEMYYAVTYGPIGGYPVYRRKHRVSFDFSSPITPNVISSSGFKEIAVNTHTVEMSTDAVSSLDFTETWPFSGFYRFGLRA